MNRKKQPQEDVTECRVVVIEENEKHGWLCTIQTPDRVLVWFGGKGDVRKIGCRGVLGNRQTYTHYFQAARDLAAQVIRSAKAGTLNLNKDKVVPILRGHAYRTTRKLGESGQDRATAIFDKDKEVT